LKNLSINISKYFFLLLFLGFFGSITLFRHAHVVDGITIVHSHPFKNDKSGNPSHNHSSNGYQLIHLLANFALIILLSHVIAGIDLPLIGKASFYLYNFLQSKYFYFSNPLRGPPSAYTHLTS